MPNTSELIEEVYIDPIKSVLFIDDKFPTYADAIDNFEDEGEKIDAEALKLAEAKDNANHFKNDQEPPCAGGEGLLADVKRAFDLTQSCRECGYIFDVEDSADTALKYQDEASFINKADLVVLDFILNDKIDSSQEALDVIERLNKTNRFNLVVVYTNNEPMHVAHEIAHFLRGRDEGAQKSKKALKRIGNFPNETLSENILPYLAGDLHSLEDWYKTLDLDGKPSEADIRNLFEVHLNGQFINNEKRESSLLKSCGTSEKQLPWICGKAVFIAVIQKSEVDANITSLLDALRECLKSFVPSPISMLIHKSINTLKEGGTELLEKAFGDEETRAALLYRALKAEFPAADDDRKAELCLADLMSKAFSVLSSGIQQETMAFGTKLLGDCRDHCKDKDVHSVALSKEKAQTPCESERLFLNVNAFLCSQPNDTGHITTGTVFRKIAKPSDVWVCVTPACDMVPERSRSGYRGKISPANYFEALKIKKVPDPKEALECAEQANHLFLKIDGDIQAFSICSESTKEPKLYVFYTQNGGYVDAGNKADLQLIEPDEKASLVMKNYSFEVIGQLRPEYASRYMAIKGDWNSRIGVDFVNFPER